MLWVRHILVISERQKKKLVIPQRRASVSPALRKETGQMMSHDAASGKARKQPDLARPRQASSYFPLSFGNRVAHTKASLGLLKPGSCQPNRAKAAVG